MNPDSADKPAVLVVDDDDAFRTQMSWFLSTRYEVVQARDRASALEALRRQSFPVVLLDLHLTPDGNDRGGLEVLRWAGQNAPGCRVILLTGESDPQAARETLRWGAWDFCSKPPDMEKLGWILERAVRLRELEAEAHAEPPVLERIGSLATANVEMAQVLRAARELAGTRLPLLILGGAGSGKTTLAREILRTRMPEAGEVAVLPPGDLPAADSSPESCFVLEQVETLEKGRQRELEALLEMPGAGAVPLSARLMATCRTDLLRLSRRGRFLPDLARRLEMARLEMPALSRRPEDLPLLARSILGAWAEEGARPVPRLAPEAETVLRGMLSHLEVGQLAALLTEAAARSDSSWIGADAFLLQRAERPETLRARRARLEAALLREALTLRSGNISQAARDLGISRPTLHDLLRKHELDPSRYRQS